MDIRVYINILGGRLELEGDVFPPQTQNQLIHHIINNVIETNHSGDVGRRTKEIELEKDQTMTIFLRQNATMTMGTDLVKILSLQGKGVVHYLQR